MTDTATPCPRRIVLLGSTGSIGTQAVDVIGRNPDRFRVVALSRAADLELLAGRPSRSASARSRWPRATPTPVAEAIACACRAAGRTASPRCSPGPTPPPTRRRASDVVLNGITGSVGLARPWPRSRRVRRSRSRTRSRSSWAGPGQGGGTRGRSCRWTRSTPPSRSRCAAAAPRGAQARRDRQRRAVPGALAGRAARRHGRQALAHPNFSMGRVVTTNSATLVNKGLEVIEAHLLFDLPFERIDVVVHPQQMIHSMVEFVDGSTIAQAGPPRMLVPIALGLSWPDRLADVDVAIDWTRPQRGSSCRSTRTPSPPSGWPARWARPGGTHPAVYNAANEVVRGRLPRRPHRVPRHRRHGGRASSRRTPLSRGGGNAILTLGDVLRCGDRARAARDANELESRLRARRSVRRRGPQTLNLPEALPLKLNALSPRSRRRRPRRGGLHRAARAGTPRPRQVVRREGDAVHGRLRAAGGHAVAARPSTASRGSRSAGTSAWSGCSRRSRARTPLQLRPVEHRAVSAPWSTGRAPGEPGGGRPRRRGPRLLQAKPVRRKLLLIMMGGPTMNLVLAVDPAPRAPSRSV